MSRLALDLGWAMGFCSRGAGDVVEHGVLRVASEHRLDGVRLRAQAQWFVAKVEDFKKAGDPVTEVFYEEITFVGRDNGPAAMHAHGKQLGNIERLCAVHRIECTGIPFNTVKAFVAGSGRASQGSVLKVIRRRFPAVSDHNEASAVAVMLTAQDKYPVPA